MLFDIEGLKVGITSGVLFNLLVLVLTTSMSSIVDEMFKSNEQGEKIFDSDTNTFKFTKKFKNEDIENVNSIILDFKQLNSFQDLVKFLVTLKVLNGNDIMLQWSIKKA